MSSRRLFFVALATGAFFASMGACKGAESSDLFDPNAVLVVEAGAEDAAVGPAIDSGSDASVADSGSTDGGPIADAAGDAAVANPDATGVFCSEVVGYCSGATAACCATKAASGPIGPYGCKAACAPAEAAITCDDDDDCQGGNVCCDVNNANGVPQTLQCVPLASCAPGGSQTVACDLTKVDDCATYLAGTTCKQHDNMAPGFGICIP